MVLPTTELDKIALEEIKLARQITEELIRNANPIIKNQILKGFEEAIKLYKNNLTS